MRILLHEARLQPNTPHQPGHACRNFRCGADAVHEHGLGQRGKDRHPRIERGIRILKDHLQFASRRPQSGGVGRGEITAFEDDRAARCGREAENRPRQR